MNCAIITVGDEILIGQVTDTNAVWIAQQLNDLGVRVGEMITVSDDPEQIHSALDRYMGSYEWVIMTGGLGPTGDDRTRKALADYFKSRMVTHAETLERITAYFRSRGRTLIEANRRQADVPEACMVLKNNRGTAPGMLFERDGTRLVALPGVPYEMKGLMQDHLLPEFRKNIDVPSVVHRTIMTQGVPESYLAAMLRDWEEALPDCVRLAYLPRPGIVRLRMTVVGRCTDEAEQILKVNIDKLLNIIPQHVFGYDDTGLEEVLGDLLREKGLTLSTAESCTGGNVARMITSVPGSSTYYTGSVIAYSNRIKSEVLKVDEQLISKKGVVSREVVEQMAQGVKAYYGTDTSIATSGIAGPDGGTADKPVGTTWICVTAGERMDSREFRFWGAREHVIEQATFTSMQMLRLLLLEG